MADTTDRLTEIARAIAPDMMLDAARRECTIDQLLDTASRMDDAVAEAVHGLTMTDAARVAELVDDLAALADIDITLAGSRTLPYWSDLSDLDRGAILMHLHKRETEGGEDATEHYPARFHDHPVLTLMSPEAASEYAARFEDGADGLDPDEWHRLYELAADARSEGASDE